MAKGFSYGGQAVIEGVMMRGATGIAIAVRKASNDIIVREEALQSWVQRYPLLRLPLIRGVLALIETMVIGLRSLSFSASEYAEGEGEELGFKELALTLIVAFAFTVGLFIVLPALVIRFLQSSIDSNVVLNLVEGAVKVGFFLAYIIAISGLRDIRRVFEYHGAEHKTIHCYEAGQELTVANVRRFSTLHPRCGTNFILLVLLTSVFVFSFFGRPPFLQRILIHLGLLPVVAGLSYEIIKLAGKHKLVQVLVYPGLLLQKLTTREPDDSQLEVAISALQAVLARDQARNAEGTDSTVQNSRIGNCLLH